MTPLPVPEDWQPQFEGQRPPFAEGNEWAAQPGNDLAVTHGAFSMKLIEPIANGILTAIIEAPDSEYLKNPRFAERLKSYALTEARVVRLEAWVSKMTDEEAARSDKGQTSPLELLRKWKTTAANEGARLGLDPVSWSRIKRDYAQANSYDLASVLSGLKLDDALKNRAADE